jgi:predicted negative regulator of RcsB-dependent stress response
MNDTVTKAFEELGNLYLAKKDKQNALTTFLNAKESRGADLLLDELISKLKLELGL